MRVYSRNSKKVLDSNNLAKYYIHLNQNFKEFAYFITAFSGFKISNCIFSDYTDVVRDQECYLKHKNTVLARWITKNTFIYDSEALTDFAIKAYKYRLRIMPRQWVRDNIVSLILNAAEYNLIKGVEIFDIPGCDENHPELQLLNSVRGV
jgi:hypothetical protein